jgi:serine protease Do
MLKNKIKLAGIFSILLLGVSALPPQLSAQDAVFETRAVPQSREQVQLSYAPVVRNASPAVVNIYTKKIVRSRRSALYDHPIFRRFFDGNNSFGAPRERVQGSLGSGVIVRANGVIVTNNHVIEGADEITVVLADRREYDAKIVLADPRTDLAILQIETGDEALATLSLSNSDNVLVGDLVLAIGNPFGVGQTVTSGIVSATARTQEGISDFGFFIQTDAAVNPGNSGGALVGIDGELLGINTAIYSRTGASNGIGFAVPANMVKSVLRAALDEGQLVRPWLGIQGQTVNSELASSLGLDRPGGVLIDDIFPGGPAARAGLSIGDVILAAEGVEIIDEGGLNFRIATKQQGENVKLGVLKGGFLEEADIALELPPEVPERNVSELDGRHPFQGVKIGNMSPRFNDELQLDPFLRGVVVLEVNPRTPAGRYQLMAPGDILVSMNGIDINRVEDLNDAIDAGEGRYVYRFRRRGQLAECLVSSRGNRRCRAIQ